MTMKKTKHDYAMWSIVSVPILCLMMLFLGSLASWNMRAAKLESTVRERMGQSDNQVQFNPYGYGNWETVPQISMEVADWYATVSQVLSKYRDLVSLVIQTETSIQTPPSEDDQLVLESLLTDFQTDSDGLNELMDQWIDRMESDQDSSGDRKYLAQVFWEFSEFLRMDFEASSRTDSQQEAIETLRRYRQLFQIAFAEGVNFNVLRQGTKMMQQVSRTAGRGVWTGEQLAEIDEILRPMLTIEEVWKPYLVTDDYWDTQWLLNGTFVDGYPNHEGQLVGTAPSIRQQWLGRVEQMRSISTDDVTQIRARIEKHLEKSPRQGNALDTLLQSPAAGQTSVAMEPSKIQILSRLSSYSAVFVNERRFARTMVAMLRYKAAHGDYPTQIQQLRQVGLSHSEYEDFDGHPFEIRYDGHEIAVSNTSGLRNPTQHWSHNQTDFEPVAYSLPK